MQGWSDWQKTERQVWGRVTLGLASQSSCCWAPKAVIDLWQPGQKGVCTISGLQDSWACLASVQP